MSGVESVELLSVMINPSYYMFIGLHIIYSYIIYIYNMVFCSCSFSLSFYGKEVWGYNDMGSTKRLQVNMANIRKKFGVKPGKKSFIINELGVGYRMCDDE